jgi:hypothetical protein
MRSLALLGTFQNSRQKICLYGGRWNIAANLFKCSPPYLYGSGVEFVHDCLVPRSYIEKDMGLFECRSSLMHCDRGVDQSLICHSEMSTRSLVASRHRSKGTLQGWPLIPGRHGINSFRSTETSRGTINGAQLDQRYRTPRYRTRIQ